MKFGGTSVKDAEAISQLCRIVSLEPRPTLVVVSALAGVTDDLINLATSAGHGNRKALPQIVTTLRQRHVDLAIKIVWEPQERSAVVEAIHDTVKDQGSLARR